jgi:hypothetical protein
VISAPSQKEKKERKQNKNALNKKNRPVKIKAICGMLLPLQGDVFLQC